MADALRALKRRGGEVLRSRLPHERLRCGRLRLERRERERLRRGRLRLERRERLRRERLRRLDPLRQRLFERERLRRERERSRRLDSLRKVDPLRLRLVQPAARSASPERRPCRCSCWARALTMRAGTPSIGVRAVKGLLLSKKGAMVIPENLNSYSYVTKMKNQCSTERRESCHCESRPWGSDLV